MKVISLCHKYKARLNYKSVGYDQALLCWYFDFIFEDSNGVFNIQSKANQLNKHKFISSRVIFTEESGKIHNDEMKNGQLLTKAKVTFTFIKYRKYCYAIETRTSVDHNW
jgi:hypothetical protein